MERFAKVREVIKRTYPDTDLRLRFITQEWSYTHLPITSRHPFAERAMPGKEEMTTPKFNRGLLLNAGLMSISHADVIYTHDVDLLPGDERSMLVYGRPGESGTAFHLAGHWERYSDSATYVGGILGMTMDSWRATNGYPNDYFGWGGEDDELSRRMRLQGIVVDRESYSPDKYYIEDLEGIQSFEDKRKQIASKDTYNIIKQELNKAHATSPDKTGLNGLNTTNEQCILIDYSRMEGAMYEEWVDEISVVILPESYPVLTKDAYESVEESQARISQSYQALYLYKQLMSKGFSWVDLYKTMTDTDPDADPDAEPDADQPIWFQEAVSIAKDPELEVYKGTPDEPVEIRDFRQKRLGKEYKHLWLDDLAVYSTTSAEVAKQMTTILRNLSPEYTGIIDGTACAGGNTIQMYPAFKNVVAIEYSHNRSVNVLRRNLEWAFKQRRGHSATIPVDSGGFLEFSAKPLRDGFRIFNGPIQVLSEYDPSFPDEINPLGEILFLDPPWGGVEYKEYKSLPIYLGTTEDDRLENVLINIINARNQSRRESRIAPATHLDWIALKLPLNFDLEFFRTTMEPYGMIHDIHNFKVMNLIVFELKSAEDAPVAGRIMTSPEDVPEVLGMEGEIIDALPEEPVSAAAAAATPASSPAPAAAVSLPEVSEYPSDGPDPEFPEGITQRNVQGIPGIDYIEDFLTPEEQESLLENINDSEWSESGTTGIIRRVQHYGYIYKYQGRQGSLDTAKPIPEFLKPLQERLEAITKRKFDQVIINEYTPGQGISPHADDAKLFGDYVVSVSLGSGATMNFNPVGNPKDIQEIYLRPGSAVFLTKDGRYSWEHSIAKRKTDIDPKTGKKIARGTRVSATFRFKKPGTLSTDEIRAIKSETKTTKATKAKTPKKPIATTTATATAMEPTSRTSRFITTKYIHQVGVGTSRIVNQIVSTSLFYMPTPEGSKEYKNFEKSYFSGIEAWMKNIRDYLPGFILRVYTDQSVLGNPSLMRRLEDLIKEYPDTLEVVEFDSPPFRSASYPGHKATFGTIVRLLPLFEESSDDPAKRVIAVRDLDIYHQERASYPHITEFLRSPDDYQMLAYDTDYRPRHLTGLPENIHKKTFGTGSLTFRGRYPVALLDEYLESVLNPESELSKKILPKLLKIHTKGLVEDNIFYGFDEIFTNTILLNEIPPEKTMIVIYYDEPKLILDKIAAYQVKKYPDTKDAGLRESLRGELQRITKREGDAGIERFIKESLEMYREVLPDRFIAFNREFDLRKTYYKVFL
jgi:alkylated DNA repair dioxygenase AlkB